VVSSATVSWSKNESALYILFFPISSCPCLPFCAWLSWLHFSFSGIVSRRLRAQYPHKLVNEIGTRFICLHFTHILSCFRSQIFDTTNSVFYLSPYWELLLQRMATTLYSLSRSITPDVTLSHCCGHCACWNSLCFPFRGYKFVTSVSLPLGTSSIITRGRP
jgi:hypothetical protein